MKVCDAHPDRKALDTLVVEGDASRIDVCDECKYAVLSLLNKPPPELGASPLAPVHADAQPRGPKWGLSLFGRKT
jgi:hypothetical protein